MPEAAPIRIKKILVAVDGSDFSNRAGLSAADLARRYSADLDIIHIANYPPNRLGVGSKHTVSVGIPEPDPEMDKLTERAQSLIDEIESYATSVGVESKNEIVVTAGSISDSIVEYAYRDNADLIVIGSKGLNAFKNSVMGSVSNGVVNKARCTVMVVR